MQESLWVHPDDERVLPLIEDLARDYDERYEPNDGVPSSFELYRYPAELFTPAEGGNFLILVLDGVTVAGGAFKRIDDETAEIKRMWTHPESRNRGLAAQVLTLLEEKIHHAGYVAIELTTGARQPEAQNFYAKSGYVPQFDPAGDLEEVGYLTYRKTLVVS